MIALPEILDSLGFHYFYFNNEYLLIFRGEALDHHIQLCSGQQFLRASCVLGRAAGPLSLPLAQQLLQYNTRHSLARVAVSGRELVILGDLPLEGLQQPTVEELVLSVAATAEELSGQILSSFLSGTNSLPDGPHPEEEGPVDQGATGSVDRPVTSWKPGPGDLTLDPDIDWELGDD